MTMDEWWGNQVIEPKPRL